MVDGQSAQCSRCLHRGPGAGSTTHFNAARKGARATNSKLEGVRRVHLARVHYHLYYRTTHEPVIEVLALWHTSRGTPPDL